MNALASFFSKKGLKNSRRLYHKRNKITTIKRFGCGNSTAWVTRRGLYTLQQLKGSFYDLKKGSSAYRFMKIDEDDHVDVLVDDLEPVDDDEGDAGVAIPGQVDSVCRRPL